MKHYFFFFYFSLALLSMYSSGRQNFQFVLKIFSIINQYVELKKYFFSIHFTHSVCWVLWDDFYYIRYQTLQLIDWCDECDTPSGQRHITRLSSFQVLQRDRKWRKTLPFKLRVKKRVKRVKSFLKRVKSFLKSVKLASHWSERKEKEKFLTLCVILVVVSKSHFSQSLPSAESKFSGFWPISKSVKSLQIFRSKAWRMREKKRWNMNSHFSHTRSESWKTKILSSK